MDREKKIRHLSLKLVVHVTKNVAQPRQNELAKLTKHVKFRKSCETSLRMLGPKGRQQTYLGSALDSSGVAVGGCAQTNAQRPLPMARMLCIMFSNSQTCARYLK